LKLSANRSEAKSDWRVRVLTEEDELALAEEKDAVGTRDFDRLPQRA
jgi:hypothetical protein